MTSELGRRGVHVSGTGIPLLYVLGLATWTELRLFLVGLVVVVFVLEFLRLVVGLDHAVYDRLTREYEADNVAGYALYMVGMAVAAFAFAPEVAVPAMLMLSIGDPVSGYLGSNDATTAKELGVLGVMFLVCFALAVPFTAPSRPPTVGVAVAAAGALGATAADGLKPVVRGYVIDDNLTIPPAAGVAMTAVLLFVGG
ncbi:dolichol kinase [Halorarum halobium]|uniref:dolichol kinase n=1 Tax=Halorarum halobium TaxID=3075121 RepID=UPI0028A69EDD|nr:dolichol kinase [Halobaculum sp. XH14]